MGMTDETIQKAVYQYNGLGHRMDKTLQQGVQPRPGPDLFLGCNVAGMEEVKNVIIVVGIIGLIALILFIKMKYGTYGYYDFQHFFDQSKENIIETYGEPIEDEYINEYCEDMTYEDIKFVISLPGEKP